MYNTYHKGLISIIYKEFLEMKESNNPILKKWTKAIQKVNRKGNKNVS